jgi:hypothetical protein
MPDKKHIMCVSAVMRVLLDINTTIITNDHLFWSAAFHFVMSTKQTIMFFLSVNKPRLFWTQHCTTIQLFGPFWVRYWTNTYVIIQQQYKVVYYGVLSFWSVIRTLWLYKQLTIFYFILLARCNKLYAGSAPLESTWEVRDRLSANLWDASRALRIEDTCMYVCMLSVSYAGKYIGIHAAGVQAHVLHEREIIFFITLKNKVCHLWWLVLHEYESFFFFTLHQCFKMRKNLSDLWCATLVQHWCNSALQVLLLFLAVTRATYAKAWVIAPQPIIRDAACVCKPLFSLLQCPKTKSQVRNWFPHTPATLSLMTHSFFWYTW